MWWTYARHETHVRFADRQTFHHFLWTLNHARDKWRQHHSAAATLSHGEHAELLAALLLRTAGQA